MVLTDTHTHQYYETIPEKRAALMQRCIDNNITRLFLPNVDAASVPLVYGLANEYPQYCYPMLGLHPCDVKEDWEEELSALRHQHSGDKRPVGNARNNSAHSIREE